MKIFANLITSASSNSATADVDRYNWSEALDVTRHAKERNFTLQWDIETSATTVNFVWSGTTSVEGTFIRNPTDIVTGVTSADGPISSGVSYISFSPELVPFMKIGAKTTGTTSTLSCHLVVE